MGFAFIARSGLCENDSLFTAAAETDNWVSVRIANAFSLWNGIRFDDIISNQQLSLFLLTSASAEASAEGAKADFFAATLSNIVYPAVTYAYFAAKADYSLTDDKSRFDFSVGASASGMATVFTRMFQFTDANNDGEFTEGTDTIVDEYPFMEMGALGYPDPKPVWGKGDFSKNTRTMSIKTDDGAFAVRLKANPRDGRTPDGITFTPMNTKVDVEIDYNKFKELKAGNFVGLDTYVISTEAKADAAVKAGRGIYIEQSDNNPTLGFAWDAKANLETVGDTEVKASAFVGASIDEIEREDMLIHAMGATAKADAGAKFSVEKATFTFKTAKAGKLVWDPVVGVGSPDDQNLLSGASNPALCTMMLLGTFLPAMAFTL